MVMLVAAQKQGLIAIRGQVEICAQRQALALTNNNTDLVSQRNC